MYCEYWSGSDSFPNGGRNIMFSTLVYNPISALFENPRNLTEAPKPVCRNVKVMQGIPGSLRSGTETKMWYHYRCDCRSGALFLFESRVKEPGSVFGFNTSYLLMRMHSKAPAIRAVYGMPEQYDANIHTLEFTWNALRVRTHQDLTPDERGAFKKFVGETRDLVVDVTQEDDELKDWCFTALEPEAKKSVTIQKSKSNRSVAINRVRRIRRK